MQSSQPGLQQHKKTNTKLLKKELKKTSEHEAKTRKQMWYPTAAKKNKKEASSANKLTVPACENGLAVCQHLFPVEVPERMCPGDH